MATLGKVLVVLNVLAAIAFLVLAGMDYSSRQNWAYAHFRGQLALHGLPLDSTDDTGRQPGYSIASSLGDGVIRDIFQGKGEPVKLQIDEVNRQLSQFRSEMDQANNLQAKRAVLAKYLPALASRGDVRDDLIRRLQGLRDDKGVEDLTKEVTDYFARAVSPKLPSGEDRPPEARRASIADLLYGIDPTQEGRARTQAVVGLAQYVGAANRQIGTMREMSERLRTILAAEQVAFIPEYQAELPELAQLAEKLKTYEARLAAQQDVVRRETVVRNARQSEAQGLQQQIEQTSQTVAAETAALDALQRRLFELQQTFAQLQAANLQTEAEIRAKETGR